MSRGVDRYMYGRYIADLPTSNGIAGVFEMTRNKPYTGSKIPRESISVAPPQNSSVIMLPIH